MKSKYIGIILVLTVTLMNAVAQFLLKIGTENFSLSEILYNFPLITGLFIYGLSAILLIYALKFGDLNVLYPIISLTFVWVTIVSIYFLEEDVGIVQMSGISSVLLGVFLITKGDARD